ncbi:MAG TPA: hydrolase [Candidatus Bathyarchaeota archaeon]|nr:hydrolase [Candidatus Bathyarchaeota archaeon]
MTYRAGGWTVGEALLSRDETALIIIDVQEKLFERVEDGDRIADSICKLIRFANILGIPIILTEQYPEGLGPTIHRIRELIPNVKPIEKIEFSCMASREFRRRISEINVKNLVLTGIEAHICVAQTAIEAITSGYKVYVVYDAISSRHRDDKAIAIERMKQHGVYMVTSEMLMYEVLRRAGTPEFKEILKLVRED